MSVRAFTYASDNLIDAQPASSSAIYVRSSASGDTSQTFTVYDNSATSYAATLAGQVESVTSNNYDSLRWVTLSATATGTVSVYSSDNATAATGDIRVDTNPTASDTLYVGLSGGNGSTYTFVASSPSAGQITIGSTTSETADNIASAINDSSTGSSTPVDNTDWAATAANGYVTATVASTVVTITDIIACKRQLAWSLTESSDNFSIRQPAGGINGTLLTTIDPGDTEYYNGDLALETEDLLTETLPAGKTGATDSIPVGGKLVMLDLECENVTSAIAIKYQWSNDDTNWNDGGTALTSMDNNDLQYSPTEHMEYIRLNITANANTSASKVNAKVIY